MSGPDRRDSRLHKGFVGGVNDDEEFGPDAAEEQFVVTNVGHHRAYHIRADVKASFSADQSSPVNYSVSDDVESEFKGRVSLYEWNGQEIFDTDSGVRVSRSEHTALDVAGEFIEEED